MAAAVRGEGACGTLGTDLNRVIEIDIVVDSAVEEADTARGRAVALSAGGDTVAAAFVWGSLDPAFLAVADSANGVFVGKQRGTARLQARTGDLRSNPISIDVTAAADTVTAATATHDTISVTGPTPDSLSDSLAVLLQDTVTTPTPAVPLANRPVTFAITSAPMNGGTAALVPDDTTHSGSTIDTVRTSAAGIASVKVRYLGGGTLPDSVVVTARARRAVGTEVPGSPITFVVQLEP